MSKSTSEVVDIVTSELTYIPTSDQKRAKSAFWSRFNDNPLCDPSEISKAVVLKLVNESRIDRWWSIMGFREWFCNQNEFKDKLEYLSHKILDSLEFVLDDPKANANAKVNAAKLILEASRKMPSKSTKVEYLDQKVSEMTKEQLEEYIMKRTKLLPEKAD